MNSRSEAKSKSTPPPAPYRLLASLARLAGLQPVGACTADLASLSLPCRRRGPPPRSAVATPPLAGAGAGRDKGGRPTAAGGRARAYEERGGTRLLPRDRAALSCPKAAGFSEMIPKGTRHHALSHPINPEKNITSNISNLGQMASPADGVHDRKKNVATRFQLSGFHTLTRSFYRRDL